MGAARDIMHDYQHVIAELTLVTGSAGVFDVVVDGEVIYSKHSTGRHAEPGEVLALFRDYLGREVPIYER
ncbi:MAG: Rdx family protein [Ilumatobacteraceae bacterium]|nr:Rdx family protein [Ilumatobacteraceae bacterium]